MSRFCALFGASPKSCIEILNDLQTTENVDACMIKPNPIYFLMAMNWLKSYKTEVELAGLFNVIEKTSRTWVWKYIKAIQALQHQKVSVSARGHIPVTRKTVLTLSLFPSFICC